MEIVVLNAKDFRLGNKLYYSKKIVDVDVNALITLNSSLKFGEGFNFYQPIPLTEEILLKCGFKKDGNFYHFKAFAIYVKRTNQHLCFRHWINTFDVVYLHQLQNLFFALMREELEINL